MKSKCFIKIFDLSLTSCIVNISRKYTDIFCLLAPVFAVNVLIKIFHHKFLRKKKEKRKEKTSLFLTFQDENSFELLCEIHFLIFNQL